MNGLTIIIVRDEGLIPVRWLSGDGSDDLNSPARDVQRYENIHLFFQYHFEPVAGEWDNFPKHE